MPFGRFFKGGNRKGQSELKTKAVKESGPPLGTPHAQVLRIEDSALSSAPVLSSWGPTPTVAAVETAAPALISLISQATAPDTNDAGILDGIDRDVEHDPVDGLFNGNDEASLADGSQTPDGDGPLNAVGTFNH